MSSGVCRTATGSTRNILLFTIRDFYYNKPRSLPQQQRAGQSFCSIQISIIFVCRSSLATRLPYSVPTLLRKEKSIVKHTRVGTLIVATIYLQLIQNRYMFRIFTVLHCSHQHCVQRVASDVEVVGYL